MPRKVTAYGLLGPTTNGIKWFKTPEELAAEWRNYPAAKIRLSYGGGEVTHGSADEVAPIYKALDAIA